MALVMLPALEQLNERQGKFARLVALGTSPADAARLCQYGSPETEAFRLLRQPNVLAAVRAITTHALVTESAPLALRTLNEILRDTKAPPNARVAAAKTLLDRAGYVTPAKPEKAGQKPLAEQDSDDLRETIKRLEDELAGRAKDVSSPQGVDWSS